MVVSSPLALPAFSGFSGVLVLIAAFCRERTQAIGESQPGTSLEYVHTGVHSQNFVYVVGRGGKRSTWGLGNRRSTTNFLCDLGQIT